MIRIGRESQCLPYAEFFKSIKCVVLAYDLQGLKVTAVLNLSNGLNKLAQGCCLL